MDEQIRIQGTGISEMIYNHVLLTKWMNSILQWFSVSFIFTSLKWWMIIFIVTYNNHPPLLWPLHTIDQSRYLWPEDTCPFPRDLMSGPRCGRAESGHVHHTSTLSALPPRARIVRSDDRSPWREYKHLSCLSADIVVHPVLKLIVIMYVQPNKCIPNKIWYTWTNERCSCTYKKVMY